MSALVEDLLLARLNQERTLDITDVDLLVLAADAMHDAKATTPCPPRPQARALELCAQCREVSANAAAIGPCPTQHAVVTSEWWCQHPH